MNIYAAKGGILKRPLYTVVPLTQSPRFDAPCLGKMAYVDGKIDSPHILLEMYHKSTHQDSKDRIINEFKKGDSHIRCIVATVALGMSLDIRDVDLVMHIGCPKTLVILAGERSLCPSWESWI